MSERNDINRPVRRRSSAASTGTGTAGGGTGCSRSAGSWKKLRRPRDLRQFRDEYGELPPTADSQQRCVPARSLDDTISTTLEQLRFIQDEDCCVVRCFNTTANGLINRGDSFKRKNESVLQSSSSDGLAGAGAGQDVVRAASRSRSQSSSYSHASYAQQLTDDMTEMNGVIPVVQTSSYTVLVLGQQQVGRSALLQQFMTSQFMAAETTLGRYLPHHHTSRLLIFYHSFSLMHHFYLLSCSLHLNVDCFNAAAVCTFSAQRHNH